MRFRGSGRGLGSILLGASLTAGCWRSHTYAPDQGMQLLDGSRAVFVATDRDTVSVYKARVVGDSIVGVDASKNARHIAVSLADVRSISMSRFNETDTVYLVIGLLPILVPIIVGLLYRES